MQFATEPRGMQLSWIVGHFYNWDGDDDAAAIIYPGNELNGRSICYEV